MQTLGISTCVRVFPSMTCYVEDCTPIRISWQCGTADSLNLLAQNGRCFTTCFQMSTHAQSTKQNGRHIWAWSCYKPELDIHCYSSRIYSRTEHLVSLFSKRRSGHRSKYAIGPLTLSQCVNNGITFQRGIFRENTFFKMIAIPR